MGERMGVGWMSPVCGVTLVHGWNRSEDISCFVACSSHFTPHNFTLHDIDIRGGDIRCGTKNASSKPLYIYVDFSTEIGRREAHVNLRDIK